MQYEICRYDFNGDGLISKEDVRIVLSYIPFKRDVSESIEEKLQTMNVGGGASGASHDGPRASLKQQKEGLYEQEEGKQLDYKDRVTDQEEIKNFVNMVFDSTPSTSGQVSGNKNNPLISFDDYLNFNKKVSSEMFYSIMSVLHERLPCAPNFFRLKKIYRTKVSGLTIKRNFGAHMGQIASPSILKVQTFQKIQGARQGMEPMTPQIKIKNKILDQENKMKKSMLSNASSVVPS